MIKSSAACLLLAVSMLGAPPSSGCGEGDHPVLPALDVGQADRKRLHAEAILFGLDDGGLYQTRVADRTREPLARLPDGERDSGIIQLSPDGRYIMFAGAKPGGASLSSLDPYDRWTRRAIVLEGAPLVRPAFARFLGFSNNSGYSLF